MKLKYDKLLSAFAVNFKLRRYIMAATGLQKSKGEAKRLIKVNTLKRGPSILGFINANPAFNQPGPRTCDVKPALSFS